MRYTSEDYYRENNDENIKKCINIPTKKMGNGRGFMLCDYIK